MQLDQPRHQEIAGAILASLRRTSLSKLANRAVRDGDPAVLQNAVGQDHARIGKDHGGLAHAASANCVMSMILSAMASRTSSSCAIATMAVPRAFFSAIRSATTARFTASSDAVGSSSRSSGL